MEIRIPGEWTAERRARAAETAQRVKPWLRSTGPKTAEGKAISSMNRYQGAKREASRVQARQIRALWTEFRVLERQGVTLQGVTAKYMKRQRREIEEEIRADELAAAGAG